MTLAGFDLRIRERSYYPDIDDPDIECVLIRAQEMARYVQQGVLDAGVTGIDWVHENRARVKEVADLRAPWPNYGPVRWVVAVQEGSKIQRPADLAGKRIATEVVNLTKRYLRGHGVTNAQIEFLPTSRRAPLGVDAKSSSTARDADMRVNAIHSVRRVAPQLDSVAGWGWP